MQISGAAASLTKIDLKSAFNHIVVRPDQWHFLGMHLADENGERGLYFDATLPFGLRSSPRIFNEFTKAIRYLAKQEEGIEDLFGYLDDFFLVGETEQSCADQLRRVKSMATRYGWALNDDKERGPAQVMELLGIEIDAPQQILRITDKRLVDMLKVLDLWSTKKTAARREIASLVGKLNFVALVCRPGRAFLRRAIETLWAPGGWDVLIRLDQGLLADVVWWRSFLPQWNGMSTFSDEHWFNSPDISLTTDACNYGFGASYGGLWLYGEFSGWFYKQSMPFKEFFAIVAAVATWGHLWRGKKIKFFTDSWTVYQCIQLRWAVPQRWQLYSDSCTGIPRILTALLVLLTFLGLRTRRRTRFPGLIFPGSSSFVPTPPPLRPQSQSCLTLDFSVNLYLQQLEGTASNRTSQVQVPSLGKNHWKPKLRSRFMVGSRVPEGFQFHLRLDRMVKPNPPLMEKEFWVMIVVGGFRLCSWEESIPKLVPNRPSDFNRWRHPPSFRPRPATQLKRGPKRV